MKKSDCRRSIRQPGRQQQCGDSVFPGETLPIDAQAEAGPFAAQGDAPEQTRQEAVNMLRLTQAQDGTNTPLSISSRQARIVLGQF
ncbi:hypothetical protein [Geomonas edaphica]|uniref:hypothetical protein n=1 Tax=Geomonas edaphica TaxID=2570226 RepID=UPI0010A7DE67|nr:hypothetical protein [Geomonas edaphica]